MNTDKQLISYKNFYMLDRKRKNIGKIDPWHTKQK